MRGYTLTKICHSSKSVSESLMILADHRSVVIHEQTKEVTKTKKLKVFSCLTNSQKLSQDSDSEYFRHLYLNYKRISSMFLQTEACYELLT